MKKYIYLLFILLFPSLLYVWLSKGQHHYKYLPIFGEKIPVVDTVNNQIVIDTIYHTLFDFNFLNQNGDSISFKNLEGKIVVAEFFFSNCEGICVKMNQEMNRVYQKTQNMEDLVILSFTVDPERDSVAQLKMYSDQFSPKPGRWHFLTGTKTDLYRVAQKGFLVSADESTDSIPAFIHDEHFVLVDKLKRIRGFYNGTDEADVSRLMDEIKVLKAEEFVTKRDK